MERAFQKGPFIQKKIFFVVALFLFMMWQLLFIFSSCFLAAMAFQKKSQKWHTYTITQFTLCTTFKSILYIHLFSRHNCKHLIHKGAGKEHIINRRSLHLVNLLIKTSFEVHFLLSDFSFQEDFCCIFILLSLCSL